MMDEFLQQIGMDDDSSDDDDQVNMDQGKIAIFNLKFLISHQNYS